MAYRSEDNPEYKRLQIEDPKRAITCPQCAGAGESLQPDQEYKSCSLCSGIGKVVSTKDKQGRPAFRAAYFITGPPLHGPKDPEALELRQKRPRSHFPAVDGEGRWRVAFSFVPVVPGSLREDRLGRALDILKRLGEAKGDSTTSVTAQPVGQQPVKKVTRKRRRRASDEDEWLPCPS